METAIEEKDTEEVTKGTEPKEKEEEAPDTDQEQVPEMEEKEFGTQVCLALILTFRKVEYFLMKN